ncbi:unnamed protein product, partial [Adineta steineri]
MEEYFEALSYYDKALEILKKTLSSEHPYLATLYSNIGSVFDKIGEYWKALSLHEKALEIYQKTLPSNHPLLATSYNNSGFVYYKMKDYSKALSYLERVLDILQSALPVTHPQIESVKENIEIAFESRAIQGFQSSDTGRVYYLSIPGYKTFNNFAIPGRRKSPNGRPSVTMQSCAASSKNLRFSGFAWIWVW